MPPDDLPANLNELAERIKRIRELLPDAHIMLIQPCDRCGMNLWDPRHAHPWEGCAAPMLYDRYIMTGDGRYTRVLMRYEPWKRITYTPPSAGESS